MRQISLKKGLKLLGSLDPPETQRFADRIDRKGIDGQNYQPRKLVAHALGVILEFLGA